ncbi:MAG: DUF3450 domain-containing protein [Myxococcales bacterium]|nr:DUF3450 domain-containing protein [Myxococcales bacterium]
MPIRHLFALTFSISLLSSPTQAASLEKMAAELARLRSEVETLTVDLDELKVDEKQQLQTLNQSKNQFEADRRQQDLRFKQLRQELEQVRNRIREAAKLESTLKPAVIDAIKTIKAPIRSGIPFRVSDRIKDLEILQQSLERDEILPSVAASRLWSRVEDELRLARENGMYQQDILVEGRSVLADVARVGMVMMFFRTEAGTYGRAVRQESDWVFTPYSDEDQIDRLKKLFEAMEKRIRVGFFEIPNALSEAQ